MIVLHLQNGQIIKESTSASLCSVATNSHTLLVVGIINVHTRSCKCNLTLNVRGKVYKTSSS